MTSLASHISNLSQFLNIYLMMGYTQYNLWFSTWCQPFITAYVDPFIFDYLLPRIQLLINMVYIQFIHWLNVTGIENTHKPNVKWIVYTHNGARYRIPLKKSRGPVASDQNDDELRLRLGKLYSEVIGPFGDYHGQRQVLADLMDESTVN